MQKKFFSRIAAALSASALVLGMTVCTAHVTYASAEEYQGYYENADQYRIKNSDKSYDSIAYCYDHGDHQPPREEDAASTPLPTYSREDYLSSANSYVDEGCPGNTSGQYTKIACTRAQIAAILYAGFPVNGTGLQQKWSISDDSAREAVQDDLWTAQRDGLDSYKNLTPTKYAEELMKYAANGGYGGQEGTVTVSGDTTLAESSGVWKTGLVTLGGTYGGIVNLKDNSGNFKFFNESGNEITTATSDAAFYIQFAKTGTPSDSYTIDGSNYITQAVYFFHTASVNSNNEAYQNMISSTVTSHALALNVSKTVETTSVSVKKVWSDNSNADNLRPASVTFKLQKTVDGKTTDVSGKTVTLTSANKTDDNTWEYVFTDMPKTENGKTITYSAKETSSDKNYTSSESGLTVTNTYNMPTTTAAVKKVWSDSSNADKLRPASATFQLQKTVDGTTSDVSGKTVTLTSANKTDDNTWEYTFTDLPKTENGKTITYSVTETSTDKNYTAAANGLTVTNTYKAPSTPSTPSAPSSHGDNGNTTNTDTTIPNGDVPKGGKNVTNSDTPLTAITDNGTPAGFVNAPDKPKTAAPQTGDTSIYWETAFVLSAAGIIGLLLMKRKTHK